MQEDHLDQNVADMIIWLNDHKDEITQITRDLTPINGIERENFNLAYITIPGKWPIALANITGRFFVVHPSDDLMMFMVSSFDHIRDEFIVMRPDNVSQSDGLIIIDIIKRIFSGNEELLTEYPLTTSN